MNADNENNEEYKRIINNFALGEIQEVKIPHNCHFCSEVQLITEYIKYPHMEEPLSVGVKFTLIFN